MNNLYGRDFYAWSNEQAALLRAGDFLHADIAHIAEEIETLGRGAGAETNLSDSIFPPDCPWTLDQAMQDAA
jgi:hypothetical protein